MSKQKISCSGCDYEENSKPSGICSRRLGDDGLSLRCVGGWSEDKYYYIGRYNNIFQGIWNKWNGELYYIDLFAGPGRCFLREYEKEVDGSPLQALKYPFKKYFFVEMNKDTIKHLKRRCKESGKGENIRFMPTDCNISIDKIINDIPRVSLSLAVIDPTGLQLKFSTLELLSKIRVDMVVIFQLEAISRNIEQFFISKSSPLDEFIGGSEWRELYRTNRGKKTSYVVNEIMNLYINKIVELSWSHYSVGPIIRSRTKNLPLYRPLFFSKSLTGKRFWDRIASIDYKGQREIQFPDTEKND